MRTLSARDAEALLDVVAELQHLDDALAFPPRLLASLARLIPCGEVAYGEVDAVAQRSLLHVWHADDDDEGVVVGDDDWWQEPAQRELYWSVIDSHPVCAYRKASGDWTTPYKISDFSTLREFRRTPVYEAFLRGVDYSIGVGLADRAAHEQYLAFWRSGGRDFDDRDGLVLTLLQPHLAARHEAVTTAAAAADALAAVEENGDGDASPVVLCSGNGVIEYATAASRALLARYLGVETGSLPAGLVARRELRVRRSGGCLHVRIARTGGLHVLVLSERDDRVERLSPREREILERVAHGKQNDLIGHELGIAPATVAKHLEHAYRKLGVSNRTAAAAVLGKKAGRD